VEVALDPFLISQKNDDGEGEARSANADGTWLVVQLLIHVGRNRLQLAESSHVIGSIDFFIIKIVT
jgi:hypothetical protein